MQRISMFQAILYLVVCLLCVSRVSQAQIGVGSLSFSIDNVTVENGYGGNTGASIAMNTQLIGSVSVNGISGNQGTTSVECYANGNEIFSWSTSTNGGNTFSWTPSSAGTYSLACSGTWEGYYANGTVSTPTITVPVTNPNITGFIAPKYKVVGIAYTVPGEQSYVQYTDTTMMGTSTSTSNSFSTNLTTSESFCGQVGGGLCGTKGFSITGTYTNSFAQQSNSSSSYAVNQTTSFVNKWNPTTGPAIDHGNDVIYVWVNPILWYNTDTSGSMLEWAGYTYDTSDDSNNMEVIPLKLSQLLNPSTIDPYTQGRLLRAWAQTNTDSSGPQITNADLANIAALDPFSNPNYTITIGTDGKTSTDGRFTQTTNQAMWYVPGDTNSYNWSYTGTATAGQGAQTTYGNSFSLEEKWNSNAFIAAISYDWKQSTTFTWTDQWNNTTTNMTGQAAVVQIVGPTGSYDGPNEFNVYVDNVYGTFMVFPVPPQ